jgi:hypothetical protein
MGEGRPFFGRVLGTGLRAVRDDPLEVSSQVSSIWSKWPEKHAHHRDTTMSVGESMAISAENLNFKLSGPEWTQLQLQRG